MADPVFGSILGQWEVPDAISANVVIQTEQVAKASSRKGCMGRLG
jgi:hypothetical protein